MLAIPVFHARVAPVLDWCSKIIIVPEEGTCAASGREIGVAKSNIFKLVRMLREQGINTLICGALSPEILNYGESIGLRIIHGIAGDIEEVLRAFREGGLDQPRYRLPGCRQRAAAAGIAKPGHATHTFGGGPWDGQPGCAPAKSPRAGGEPRRPQGGPGTGLGRNASGRGAQDKAMGGQGGFCVCPRCGSKKDHERGIPCSQVRCPECSSAMTRG